MAPLPTKASNNASVGRDIGYRAAHTPSAVAAGAEPL